MRRASLAVLLAAFLLPGEGEAGPISVLITRARYVALGYDTGENRFVSELQAIGNPDLVLPADLAALQNLREQLEAWGQYVVTTKPQDAELLFAVRTGRRAAIGGGVRAGGVGGGLQSGGPVARAELSSADDMLSIYESSGGQMGALLWRQRQEAGRGYPGQMFQELKQGVEAAPKKPAPAAPPKP
jgi:hypothetical protein